MNGFALHNINHTSPSSLNMWSGAPCAWIARYLFNKKFSFSLAAKAGVLAEDAVVNVIARGWTQEDATAAAIADYAKASAFGVSDADAKRGDAIPGMIDQAITQLKEFGEPEFDNDLLGKKQKKIELLCKGNDWELPVIGYLDFHFPKHGLVVDLKTTMRLPSEMSNEHTRQGGIYRKAMNNQTVKFLYVTGKGAKWHEITDVNPILSEVKSILNRQEAFLRLGDAELLRSVIPVQASSFYWSGDSAIRKEMYEI